MDQVSASPRALSSSLARTSKLLLMPLPFREAEPSLPVASLQRQEGAIVTRKGQAGLASHMVVEIRNYLHPCGHSVPKGADKVRMHVWFLYLGIYPNPTGSAVHSGSFNLALFTLATSTADWLKDPGGPTTWS